MRISDWSSDVCSSDLHRHCHHHLAPADGRDDAPLQRVRSEMLDGAHGSDRRFKDGKGDRGRDLCELFKDDQRFQVAEAKAAKLCRDVDSQKAHFGIAARSEEHTSELQSLMRISYAVFCLKTKKQYTNIIQTNLRTSN